MKQNNLNPMNVATKTIRDEKTNTITKSDAPAAEIAPKIANDYQVLEEIGHGAQGRIFKAISKSNGRMVVIKLLDVNSVKSWKEYELFKREGDVLKTLDMPGIAHFYDAVECLDEDPAYSYIVQEYIDGASLQKMMMSGHRFKMDDVYDILIQAMKILLELHRHVPPVIHRDIKPSNLMISTDRDGQYKVTIIDFGAVANPQVQGGGSTVAGTYGYMPPEQLMGKPCPASDVYALAAVAVHLFSGKSPADMPTKDFRLIFEPDMQDKPHELVTLLRNMLEPNVENRLSDIPAIIEQLEQIRKAEPKKAASQKYKTSVHYSNQYESNLETVQFIGQNGNFELWQKLPDNTPRDVPGRFKSKMRELDKYDINPLTNITISKSGCLCFTVFFILFVPIMTITVNGLESYIGFTASWLLTLAVVGIIGIFLSVLWQSHALIKIEDDCYTYERNIDSLGSVCKFNHKTTISDLLSEGRKGIATITKIEYIPTQIFAGKLTEWNGLKVVQRRPNFKVQYKFNPPDDRREEDIIHSFVTHIEPEGHYAVGDPLPILYRIEDKFFHDEVTSMPFPMPIEDIVNMRDVADLSMSKDTRQETSHGAVNDNTFEDFIHDIQTAKNGWNLTELNRLIQDADPETLCSKKDISIQTLQSILLDDNYKAVHESCVSALFTIAFPYDRRSKKPYLEAIDPIMSYLAATPRDFNHPTIDVIEKIMNCIENRYQSSQWKGMVALPDRFWLLLLDIIHDKAAAPSLVKLLSDRYLQLAPDHYFENFKNEIVLSQSNRSFLRYSEDGSIRMVGWNQ